jgi:hypothetical protein
LTLFLAGEACGEVFPDDCECATAANNANTHISELHIHARKFTSTAILIEIPEQQAFLNLFLA